MTKLKTYPWDPADVIETGEDAILFLEASFEDFDTNVFDALLDCIARSKGVAEIAGFDFDEAGDGGHSVTITTTSGVEETIAVAPAVSLATIRQALTPRDRATPVSG